MNYYKNTSQISELSEYKYKLPKYGKSTTDPTYYEPTATRIANMYKAANNSTCLYDYDDVEKMPDIEKVHCMPGRKPGMTQEEISQEYNDTLNNYENEKKKREDETASEEKAIEAAKKQAKAILSDNSENSTNTTKE